MQPGDHRNYDGSPSRVGLMRGILVIVTAIAVGAFVLSQGFDDNDTEAVAAESEAAAGESTIDDTASANSTTSTTLDQGSISTEAMAEETTVDDTTTTAPAAPAIRAPQDVTVLVLNAAGTKGIAGRGSEILQQAGYPVLAPKNATQLGPTAVLFTEQFDAEAQEVASLFGLDPVPVVAAYDPANPPIDDIQNAIVIVVIGEDNLIDI